MGVSNLRENIAFLALARGRGGAEIRCGRRKSFRTGKVNPLREPGHIGCIALLPKRLRVSRLSITIRKGKR